MTLAAVTSGRREEPYRVMVAGVEGVGKSTFAAGAPKPIFLGAEDGTGHLDVHRFPTPSSWAEVLEAIRVLSMETHDFSTLAIDTVDWLEPIIWAHCCKRDQMENIEAYGYGKGYATALDEWRLMIKGLEGLKAKGMNVVLLAHSWIKPFKNPEGEDFDRYELKLHARAGGLLKEWSDAVLFANHETYAEKDKRTKRVRGVSTGARLLFTTRTAAYDAKNRYDLPESLPLSWAEFDTAARARRPAEPAALRAEIERKAKQLGGDLEKKTMESLARVSEDAGKLAQLNAWVNAKMMERENNA